MVFHRSLSDSKSPQVSRTRLRILAVLSNADIWIFSAHPPTSKFSRTFNNPLIIVPKAPITIGTMVTFMFHSKVEVLILLFTFLQIYSVVRRDSKVNNFASSLFSLNIIRSSLLAGIRWSVCMLKSQRSLCVSFSRTGAGLCRYTPSPVVYLRSITDTVDAPIRTLFWLTGVQTSLVFSYSAAQSCPTLSKLWFSLFLSPSQRVAANDNLAVGLPVQRVYGLSFWSSYRFCSCFIGRCVSHHQW